MNTAILFGVDKTDMDIWHWLRRKGVVLDAGDLFAMGYNFWGRMKFWKWGPPTGRREDELMSHWDEEVAER